MKDSIRDKINDIETLNTSYERFVPKEFLTLLEKDAITDVNIGDSTSLKMGVLFSDMRNFTGISEKMSPEDRKGLYEHLEELIRNKVIYANVERVYDISEIHKAIDKSIKSGRKGKILVSPNSKLLKSMLN